MKALTICQPYASLIVGWPELEDVVAGNPADFIKRMENRPCRWSYRGPLLIHAGKSKGWLKTWDGMVPPNMPFGAILGSVDVVGCYSVQEIQRAPAKSTIGWLKDYLHASGPYCLVLRHPRRLLTPIPYSGQQGLDRKSVV